MLVFLSDKRPFRSRIFLNVLELGKEITVVQLTSFVVIF